MSVLQLGALLVFVVGVLCIIAALLDERQEAGLAQTDLERRIRGRR